MASLPPGKLLYDGDAPKCKHVWQCLAQCHIKTINAKHEMYWRPVSVACLMMPLLAIACLGALRCVLQHPTLHSLLPTRPTCHDCKHVAQTPILYRTIFPNDHRVQHRHMTFTHNDYFFRPDMENLVSHATLPKAYICLDSGLIDTFTP